MFKFIIALSALTLLTTIQASQLSSSISSSRGIGYKAYVDQQAIRPGQVRIAKAGVKQKIEEAVEKGYVRSNDQSFSDIQFDNGSSIIPESNALPVVLVNIDGKDWMILLDGHHDFLANKAVGGKTVPIEIKDRIRNEHDVWSFLKTKGYVYTQSLDGKDAKQLPASFDQLEDDPYRYFVKLAMWEAKTPQTPFEQSKPGTKGLTNPLAVKWKDKKFNGWHVEYEKSKYATINLPFVEFAVADLLYKYAKQFGFDYKAGDEKDLKTFQEMVEKARAIIVRHGHEDYRICSFNVIQSRQIAETLIKEKTICSYVAPYISAEISKS